jgi:Na+-driven multidrug efflux pump
VVYLAAAVPIFQAINNDAEVVQLGVPALRVLALFQVPLTVAIVMLHSLRGAGETRFPMVVTLIGGFCIRLPLAWLCGIVWEGGLIGAWIGMCGDMLFRAVVLFARYLQGGWMHKSV